MEAHGSRFCCPQTPACSPDKGLVTLQYYRGGLVVGRCPVVLSAPVEGRREGGFFSSPSLATLHSASHGFKKRSQDVGL